MPKLKHFSKIIIPKIQTFLKKSFLLLACLLIFAFKTDPPDKKFLSVKKVVIDAGHGGHDTGCLGSFAKEKDVALSIALKLGTFIEKNYPDVEVIYTRKKDVFIGLNERAKIANSNDADLFICIHANSGNPKAYGTETYVMGETKEEANLNVAMRENSAIFFEDDYKTKYVGFDPNSIESYAAMTLLQRAYKDQSLEFAAKVQDQFKKIGRKDRGVKLAGFLVLYKTYMPSVLIETGFLTNKTEEKFLTDEENQEKMASAIFNAFKEYKEKTERVVEDVLETSDEEEKPKEEKTVKPNPDLYTYREKKHTTENTTNEVVFRVQVLSSQEPVEINKKNFNGFDNVFEYQMNGRYKYAIGNETSYEKAVELQKKVQKKGFDGAFIVAFKGNKRITVKEAKQLLNEN